MARTPDVIVRDGPAPSANSDAPMVPATAPPPLNASNDVRDQESGVAQERGPNNPPPAGDQTAGNQAGDQGDQGTGQGDQQQATTGQGEGDKDTGTETTELELDADGQPKYPDGTPAWFKREITKARNRQREAENTARTASQQLDAMRGDFTALRDQVAELTAKVAAPPKTPDQPLPQFEQPRPIRDAFDNPESYEAALIAWGEQKSAFETEQRIARESAEREAQAAAEKRAADEKKEQDRVAAELADINAKWTQRREAAIADIADYVEVAENDALKISMPMAHAIYTAENGPQIAYHLGKNPAEAERIFSIPNPGAQIFEMGKLAATLAASARPAVSKAPPPIRPLTTQANGADDSAAAEEDMDAYGARRSKELQAARRPFLSTSH